jgi:hypothetical protein
MRSLAENYRYYDSLWLAFGDKKAEEKRNRILKSIPAQSLAYFWKIV